VRRAVPTADNDRGDLVARDLALLDALLALEEQLAADATGVVDALGDVDVVVDVERVEEGEDAVLNDWG
jgi:hypothetical protein